MRSALFRPATWLALAAAAAAAGCAGGPPTRAEEGIEAFLRRGDREFEARRYGPALEAYRLAAFAADQNGEEESFARAASQVASVLTLQGVPAEAETWLARAGVAARPEEPDGWSRYLLARGLGEWKADRRGDALATFGELYNFCFLHDQTPRAMQAAQMATIVASGPEQLEWARRGIEAAATTGNAAFEAPLWANLGWLLDARGLHAEAVPAFERSLELSRSSDASRIERARAEWAYAHALRKAGRTADAQRRLDELLAVTTGLYMRERGGGAAEYLARTLEDLAELDVLAGRTDRALERLALARSRYVEAGAVTAAPETLRALDDRVRALRAGG